MSRSTVRRVIAIRPGARRTYRHLTMLVAARTAHLAVFAAKRETALVRPVAELPVAHVIRIHAGRPAEARRAARATRQFERYRHTLRSVVTRHAVVTQAFRRVALSGGMSAVISYARSQLGREYVTGGTGGSGFDCSGLTQQAYAQAGIALPHSSRAQAARARNISRRQARPGDLVVGPGHVGIYMGHGMMIDAGNHRTGVVYRKLFSGLQVERL